MLEEYLKKTEPEYYPPVENLLDLIYEHYTENNPVEKNRSRCVRQRVTQTDSCFNFSLNHQYQYVPARTPIGGRICQ